MTIQYDNLNSTISAVGTDTNIPVNIQPKGTGGLNLLGSGQNLLLNSSSFTNVTYWSSINASITGSQADPFGGTTAALLTADGTTNNHSGISAQIALTSGITYTQSIYFKAGTNNFVQIRSQGAVGGNYANFDLSTGVAGTTTAASSITPIGNGWYRCSLIHTSTTTGFTGFQFYIITSNTASAAESNTLTTTVFFYAPQIEIGSVANTYVPTTTTAIYGTPTLTFSGVAGLGLQSDGSLYVQPAGTGAIQASATTSTATGGNARGQNAVDWSTSRYQSNHVASGAFATIAGGYAQVGSGIYSFIGGGNQSIASGQYATIIGGVTNQATGIYSFVGNGISNSATGYFGFVGNGFTNSTTSNSAVTTQSATMNGTTAVTLSGSNASIKVGQYISGTSIGGDTYVVAISGTSLTLSKIATGSTTNTISFFTPHGVVVGGGNNQATGSYSFIGGGGNAGTATARNSCAADWGFIGGGTGNTIGSSATGSVIAGGGTFNGDNFGNNVTAPACAILGGWQNSATAFVATVGGGRSNVANGRYSFIGGGNSGLARSITGYTVFPANELPFSGGQGQSQAALVVLGVQTTDATATALRSDASAAGSTNQVILPNNSAYFFRGEVISGVTGGGDTKGWTIEGVIKRGAGVGTTALVGTPTVTSMYADVGAATWAIAVTADTTNGGLQVTFTGQLATTIRTVAQIRTTEMTY